MQTLVACLSTGKGTWTHVLQLLNQRWDKIILITNEFGKENFKGLPQNAEFIVIDADNNEVPKLKDYLIQELKPKIRGEVALNIASGSGKEHMALFSALINLGVPIKLISASKDGFEEI